MENSHKRMLMEMEEKHRRELAALQAEKEQALAEETQVGYPSVSHSWKEGRREGKERFEAVKG